MWQGIRVHTPSGEPVPARPGKRAVVLVSGTGSNLAALLEAHDDPAYGVRVVGVVSDRPGIRALDLAREAGLPTAVVRLGDFDSRPEWDVAVTRAVSVFEPDLVVLAGFMKILGAAFLDRFGGRTINTHPALLPAFPGAHGVRDALAHGVKVSGCTVIRVDAGVDTGPILAQRAVDVLDDDDEPALQERIKAVETPLLVATVGRIARGELALP